MKNLIIITLLMSLIGCTDQLDVTTYNNITGSSFWKVPGDAEAYVIGIQSNWHDLQNSNNTQMTISEGRADLVRPGSLGPRLTGPVELHTQTALTGAGDWTSYYNLIHHTNILLANTPGITFNDAEEMNRILAQGHLYRALVYFDLARIYGGVPIITDPTLGKPDESEYPSRASKEATFDFIKSDIEEAIALFPEDGISNKNFLSKVAAWALKADVYMWTAKALNPRNSPNLGDLNTALAAMDLVLASPDVAFEPVYANAFPLQANSAGEYIFANFYGIGDNIENNIFQHASLRAVQIPNDWAGGDFPHALTDEGLSRISYTDYMNDVLYDPSDLRFANNCVNLNAADNVLIKFPGHIEVAANRRYWDNDIPIYRYTDILLLKAEALNTLGRPLEAIPILNQTRNRGGIGDYAGANDQASVEREILDERARDLCWENKRWWDLCRAHLVGTYVARFMTNRGDDSSNQDIWNYYYWPVAESVVLANPKIEQSPGY